MKKFLRTVLITTAAVGSISGSAAAVVACGNDATKNNDPSDEQGSFKEEVDNLASTLSGETLVFDYGATVTSTKIKDALKAILENYSEDSYYANIDFVNVTLQKTSSIVSQIDKVNPNDGDIITFDVEFRQLEGKAREVVTLEMAYELRGRPIEHKYDAETLNSILSETISSGLKFSLNDAETGYDITAIEFDYKSNDINEGDLELVMGVSSNQTPPSSFKAIPTDFSDYENLPASSYVWLSFKQLTQSGGTKLVIENGVIEPAMIALPTINPTIPEYSATNLNNIITTVANGLSYQLNTAKTGYDMQEYVLDYAKNSLNNTEIELVFAKSASNSTTPDASAFANSSSFTNLTPQSFVWVSFKTLKNTTITGSLVPKSVQLPAIAPTEKSIGSLDAWNKVMDTVKLPFNESGDKFELGNTSSEGWPEGSGTTEAHYVYSLDGGATWKTDKSNIGLLDHSVKVTVSIRANEGFYIGEHTDPKSVEFTTPAKESEELDVSIINNEINRILASIRRSPTRDKDYETISKSYLSAESIKSELSSTYKIIFAFDDKFSTKFDTLSGTLAKDADTIYVGAELKTNDTLNGAIVPASKLVSTIETSGTTYYGTAADWNPIIKEIKVSFTQAGSKYTINEASTKSLWPFGYGYGEMKYVFSTDGGSTWLDKSEVGELEAGTTIKVSIRSLTGDILNSQDLESNDASTPAPSTEYDVTTLNQQLKSSTMTFAPDTTKGYGYFVDKFTTAITAPNVKIVFGKSDHPTAAPSPSSYVDLDTVKESSFGNAASPGRVYVKVVKLDGTDIKGIVPAVFSPKPADPVDGTIATTAEDYLEYLKQTEISIGDGTYPQVVFSFASQIIDFTDPIALNFYMDQPLPKEDPADENEPTVYAMGQYPQWVLDADTMAGRPQDRSFDDWLTESAGYIIAGQDQYTKNPEPKMKIEIVAKGNNKFNNGIKKIWVVYSYVRIEDPKTHVFSYSISIKDSGTSKV